MHLDESVRRWWKVIVENVLKRIGNNFADWCCNINIVTGSQIQKQEGKCNYHQKMQSKQRSNYISEDRESGAPLHELVGGAGGCSSEGRSEIFRATYTPVLVIRRSCDCISRRNKNRYHKIYLHDEGLPGSKEKAQPSTDGRSNSDNCMSSNFTSHSGPS